MSNRHGKIWPRVCLMGMGLLVFTVLLLHDNSERGDDEARFTTPHSPSGTAAAAILPPGASWTADEAQTVPYQQPRPPFKTPLRGAAEAAFLARCRAGGYTRAIDTSVMPPTIAGVGVHSELFLSRCDGPGVTDSDSHCATVTAVRAEVDILDRALLSDPVIRKRHRDRPPKPGQGNAARGWGIAGPFTNKWLFYAKHLRSALDLQPRSSSVATEKQGLHLCEVGFLAGHSTAVFSAVLGHRSFAAVHIYDLPQPGTGYSVVGMETIRDRFRSLSPSTEFRFSAAMSREGIHASIASGWLRRCDFISLDGSKMTGDVVQDFRLLSRTAHSGTVVVCDDVWTSRMLKAATPTEAAGPLKDHNSLLGVMVRRGMLDIVEVWHSDVTGWPAYGNVALRFRLLGDAFEREAEELMRLLYPVAGATFYPTPLPPERLNATGAWALTTACSTAPVNALAHAAVGLWSKLHLAIADCLSYDAAASAPWRDPLQCGQLNDTRFMTGLVNPFDFGPHVLVWASSRRRIPGYAAVCFVNPVQRLDAALGAVLAGAVTPSLPNGSSRRCPEPRVYDRQATPDALGDCGVVVLDARSDSWGGGAAVSFLRALLTSYAPSPRKAYRMVALRNIHAAGIVAAVNHLALDVLRLRKWPRRDPALSVPELVDGALSRPSLGTAVGPLTPLEREIVTTVLSGTAHIAYGDLPLDPSRGRWGTLVITRKNLKLQPASSAAVFGWSAVTDSTIGPPD